jgi:hypothetical protein
MDETNTGESSGTAIVRRLRNPRIGFIGRASLTPQETGIIWYIGRCIARLGHTIVFVEAKGAATALKEGVVSEEGKLDILETGVIESADHTLIYPDPQLLERLKKKYPDITTRTDVAIIRSDQLNEWYEAVRTILSEKGIPLPD